MLYLYQENNSSCGWKIKLRRNDTKTLVNGNEKMYFSINSKIPKEIVDDIANRLAKAPLNSLTTICHEKTVMSFNYRKAYYYIGHIGDDTKFNMDIFLISLDLKELELLNVKMFGAYAYAYIHDEAGKTLSLALLLNKNSSNPSGPAMIFNFKNPSNGGYVQKILKVDSESKRYVMNVKEYDSLESIPKTRKGKCVMDTEKHLDILNPEGKRFRLPIYRPKRPSYEIIYTKKGKEDDLINILKNNYKINYSEENKNGFNFHLVENLQNMKWTLNMLESGGVKYVTMYMHSTSPDDIKSLGYIDTLKASYPPLKDVTHLSVISNNGMLYHLW